MASGLKDIAGFFGPSRKLCTNFKGELFIFGTGGSGSGLSVDDFSFAGRGPYVADFFWVNGLKENFDAFFFVSSFVFFCVSFFISALNIFVL